jgi:hypothetical protein
MTRDEVLDSWASDLVSQKRNEPCVKRLLAAPAGSWISAERLVGNQTEDQVPDMRDVSICWLSDPKHNENYVVIVFYCTRSFKTFGALFNRKQLVERE